MRNFLKCRLWVLFALLLSIASCSHEEFLNPAVKIQGPISVTEARTWVESFMQQGTNANQRYAKRTILWKQAVLKKASNGTAYVQIPLDEDSREKRVVFFDEKQGLYTLAPKLQLIVFKDPAGNHQLQVMELLPTGEYAYSHQGFTDEADFSGTQFIRDWSGNFIKGYKVEKGKAVGQLWAIDKANSKARLQGCQRWVFEYLFVGCVKSDGTGTVVGTTTEYPLGSPRYPSTPDQSDPLSYLSCNGAWTSNGSYEYEICSPDANYDPYNPSNPSNPSDPFNPSTGSGPIVLLELSNNKKGLFGPCPGLTDKWQQQINFRAPIQVVNKLNRLASYPDYQPGAYPGYMLRDNWYVQAIASAAGTLVNLDNFSVFMNDLPTVDGRRLSVGEFAEYVRLHINDFVDTSLASFSPQIGTGENETGMWQSSNATGAVISININVAPNIPGDDGSVIVSEHAYGGQESAGWTFSTIHDPFNHNHPVSGTRTFGVYETADGYIFYTQGADRLTSYGLQMASWVTNGLPFSQADQLWISMQSRMAQFINSHQANAQIVTPITNRPKWDEVKKALDENRSLSTVPCN